MKQTYTVVLLREEDSCYSVSVPALEGCATWGESLPEALRMAEEAISLYLEELQAQGDPIPEDVGPFTMEMGDAAEACVYKVAVEAREVEAVG